MRRFFLATFLTMFLTTEAFATVVFVSLLPNPEGDDTLSEYIEIYNTGCSIVDISGYSLSDASGKSYTLLAGTTIGSHEVTRFPYQTTKIALNNSGDEALYLKDVTGNIIDEYHYSGTQKDGVILEIPHTDTECIISPPETGSGAISGETTSGSGSGTGEILFETGAISREGTGGTLVNTGETISGVIEMPIFYSGTSSTGGEISIDTGSTGSTLENTGATIGEGSSSVSTGGVLAGEVLPDFLLLSLQYTDIDKNKKIDTLYVEYSLELTGSFQNGSVALYSKTGGLSQVRINTLTGLIEEASFSGKFLILSIVEQDLEKESLTINNTTSSDLRLKTLSSMSFTSILGQVPPDFLLTSSFSNYQRVSRYEESLVSLSDMGAPFSEISSGVLFPEIIPTIQSPTNNLYSSGGFSCTSSECRINITLEPIFTGGFMMKDYTCSFGTGGVLSTDSDCNPATLYYYGSGILEIELRSKKSSGEVSTRIFPVLWVPSSSSSNATTNTPLLNALDTGNPVAVLELDSKWKENYYQNGENALICYSFTCSINFTAEKSYDPEGSVLSFLWIYGLNSISTSKDPGGKKYGIGKHAVTLRVIDQAGNFDEVIYTIEVVGPKPKEEKKKIQESKTKEKKSIKKILSALEEKKKKPRKIKMVLASPPEILLQGKNEKMIREGKYLCEMNTKGICSFNLTLTEKLRGYDYIWYLDGEKVHDGKNPKSWNLTQGLHKVKVMMFRSSEESIVTESTIEVDVIPGAKKKSSSKAKKPKTSLSEKIIPTVEADSSDSSKEKQEANTILFPLFFIIGILITSLLRKRNILR